MRQIWNERLRAEGLGEIDFADCVPSSAAQHKARTSLDTEHFSDPEVVALVGEILAEYRVPEKHRRILYGVLRGKPLRDIASGAGVSKDTAHRVLLRYVGNEDYATTAEVSVIAPRVPLVAARTKEAKGTRAHRRPLSRSTIAAVYFERGPGFAAQHSWRWERDREVWDRHMAGCSRRSIGRDLGMADQTVQRSIDRVRRAFFAWLKTQQPREQSDSEQIGSMFAELSNFRGY